MSYKLLKKNLFTLAITTILATGCSGGNSAIDSNNSSILAASEEAHLLDTGRRYAIGLDTMHHADYDEDILFDSPSVKQSAGTELGVDMESTWKVNKNIDIKNLLDVIRWRDKSFTRTAMTSDTKTFTPNGFVQIEPALQANETSYKQYLKPQGDRSDTSWLLQSKYYSSLTLFGLGVGNARHASVVLWPEAQTIEAKYKYRNMYVSLGLDDFDASKTKAFWLSFGMN